MYPRISIITPSYNQGQYIRETIESVLNQDYPNLEYIIVDGGSTDNTLDIIKEYEERIIWVSEKDTGQANAINKGFRMASGEIVAWLNSDDTYEPGALRAVAPYFEQCSHLGLLYGEGYIIDSQGKKVKRFENTLLFNMWMLIYVWDYIMQPTAFFRRECLESVGFLNESLNWTMDWDLWIKLSVNYEVCYIGTFLANSREYEDTKTSTGGLKRIWEIKKLTSYYSGQRFTRGWWLFFLDWLTKCIPIRIIKKMLIKCAISILKHLPIPDNNHFCKRKSCFCSNSKKPLSSYYIENCSNKSMCLKVYLDGSFFAKVSLAPLSNINYSIPCKDELSDFRTIIFRNQTMGRICYKIIPISDFQIQ